MLFNDVVSLISVTYTDNGMGDSESTETKKEVFADRQSVRQSEFYQAAATGLKPELMFVIRSIDYSQEPRLEHNGKTYKIYRTYEKDSEMIELVCQGVTNGVI